MEAGEEGCRTGIFHCQPQVSRPVLGPALAAHVSRLCLVCVCSP